jgi:hypothetical protein
MVRTALDRVYAGIETFLEGLDVLGCGRVGDRSAPLPG